MSDSRYLDNLSKRELMTIVAKERLVADHDRESLKKVIHEQQGAIAHLRNGHECDLRALRESNDRQLAVNRDLAKRCSVFERFSADRSSQLNTATRTIRELGTLLNEMVTEREEREAYARKEA